MGDGVSVRVTKKHEQIFVVLPASSKTVHGSAISTYQEGSYFLCPLGSRMGFFPPKQQCSPHSLLHGVGATSEL